MDKNAYVENSFGQSFRVWLQRGCISGSILFLATAMLDHTSNPDRIDIVLICKLFISFLLLLIAYLNTKVKSPGNTYRLGYTAVFCLALALSFLIMNTGGKTSSYIWTYVLVFCLIGYLPATFSFLVTTAIVLYSMYLLPIFFYDKETDVEIFLTSNVFMIAAFCYALVCNKSNYQRLKSEFEMEYELKENREKLEETVNARTMELSPIIERLEKEIAERKGFEHKLTKAAQEWRKTFDATKDIIMMLDNEFVIVRTNEAALKFFNRSYHEIIGNSIEMLLYTMKLTVDSSLFKKIIHTKRREETESYCLEKHIWLALSIDPILDHQESVTGSVIIMRDVTDIKKMQDSIMTAKNDWEDTFNIIVDMITVHDMDFNIMRANRAAEKMLKLPDPKGEGSRKCFQYYHGTDSPPSRCPSCTCLKTGKFAAFERFEPHLDVFVEIRAIPRLDSNNQLIGLIHIVRDITDVKTSAEEKSRLQEQLLHVQKLDSIGRLAGAIAHDFNNLISVINGYSELALKELPAESSFKDHISAIHGAGEKAAALTGELLAFSRKQVLEMRVININTVVDGMTKMLGRLISEDVIFEFHAKAPVLKVQADPIQLEQVLMNLAINARDAMPEGGNLTITTCVQECAEEDCKRHENMRPDSCVVLSVRDTGTGMSSEVQEKIFEPFFSTKEIGKGTGMGLATVYGIVKQHNGHIEVKSSPGEGTTFFIYLPVAEGEIEEITVQNPERIEGGNETILVVDDEPLLRELIEEMLAPLGYRVLGASDGEDALRISDTFNDKIDLLLTDVIMPGMNGKKLADALTARRAETKVVFMSGYSDDAIAHHGVLDEGVVLIQKPLTEKSLTGRIREVLDADSIQRAVCPENLGEFHILLADDNEDIRKLIQFYLKDYTCEIDIAENGALAVEKFKGGSYDFVLMDMQMPKMDGLTATQEIRTWEKERDIGQTTIIALTGNEAPEHVARCLAAGYTSHLAKPITKDQLTKTLFSFSTMRQTNTREAKDGEGEKVVAHVDIDLKDLIPEYLEERQHDIKKIQSSMQAGDFETVRILGHTLKGSGGGFGFDIITDVGLHLEEAAKQEDLEAIKKCLQKLTDYVENVEVVYE